LHSGAQKSDSLSQEEAIIWQIYGTYKKIHSEVSSPSSCHMSEMNKVLKMHQLMSHLFTGIKKEISLLPAQGMVQRESGINTETSKV